MHEPDQRKYELNWQLAKTKALADGLRVVEHGWEQHVVIDEDHGIIYRYPRHQAAAAKLHDEVLVLREIHRHVWPIELPVMRDHNAVFTSYNYIQGEVLDENMLSTLHGSDFEHIGFALGEFLAQMHALDHKVIEQKKTKQDMTLLDYYSQRIRRGKESHEHFMKANKELDKLIGKDPSTDEVVVHGDLHGYNIVINPETKQLNGVIDLSEMEIGGRHQDFRKIFMTDHRLLGPSISGYLKAGGVRLDPGLVKLWAFVNEWANLSHFAADTANPTYQRAYAHLKKWGEL